MRAANMLRRGVSQAEVARRVGVTATAVCKWEQLLVHHARYGIEASAGASGQNDAFQDGPPEKIRLGSISPPCHESEALIKRNRRPGACLPAELPHLFAAERGQASAFRRMAGDFLELPGEAPGAI
jgi:transposase-like protein